MKRDLLVGKGMLVLLCLVAPLWLAGCGTHNVATVKTFELVTNYDRMSSNYEPKLSLVYVVPGADLGAYDTLVLKPVRVSDIWVKGNAHLELFRPYIEEQLHESILATKTFKKVVVDPQYINVSDPKEKILVLETVVTRLESGNGTARYFLQLGATDFQIEGRMFDARTQRTVLEFAERRRYLGESPWEPSVKTFSSEYTLKQTIKTVTQNVGDFIKDLSGVAARGAKVAKQDTTSLKTNKSS